MTVFRMCAAPVTVFAFTLVLFGAVPAKAEGQCPPGYFQTGGRDYIACAPMGPVSGDEGPGGENASPFRAPSAPVRPSKPGFMAMAYHGDTASVWTSTGHRTLDGARQRVLRDCNAATGGGCIVAETLDRHGQIFVTEDAMGQLWIKADAYDKDPRRFNITQWNPSIELCLKNSFGCRFLGFHESGYVYLDEDPARDQSQNRYPQGQLSGLRWAMVARPTVLSGAGAQNKSWLISGKSNSAAVRKDVLERCQADSGAPCTISAYAAHSTDIAADNRKVGKGLLVHFIDARGQNRWTSAVADATGAKPKKGAKSLPDPVTVKGRIDRICPPEFPCKVVATYDAETPRVQIVEDAK